MTPEQFHANLFYLLAGILAGPSSGVLAIASISHQIKAGYDKRARGLLVAAVIIATINVVLPMAVLFGALSWPAASLFTAGFVALGVPFFAWATYGYGILTGQIRL